ncbi:MAG: hypothetical protein NC200_06370, partial [Candidatus Gastranaerophilales bacterium]|nr:hypothetical protein [Candidatus Gastranaerophilales bacterium]
YGGAIYNSGTLSLQDGSVFDTNYVLGDAYAEGGAISNSGTIREIVNTRFVNNYVIASEMVYGGAIANTGTSPIISLIATFSKNRTQGKTSYGGAVYNIGTIQNTETNYSENTSSGTLAYGGAVANIGTITEFVGSFESNTVSGVEEAYGGAIYNTRTISTLDADFTSNIASGGAVNGGAIANVGGTIGTLTGDFSGNSASGESAKGGAIYNTGTISNVYGSFVNNFASGTTNALGGAIYTTSSMNFIAEGVDNRFSGNYITLDGGKTKINQAIYVDGANVVLNFSTTKDAHYTFDDDISGSQKYTVNLNSDDNSAVYTLNNHIVYGDVNFNAGTLTFNADTFADANTSLNAVKGNIIMQDGAFTDYSINKMTSKNTVFYNIDLDSTVKDAKGNLIGDSDTLHVGAGSSGLIYLEDIGNKTSVDEDVRLVIQVIYKENSSDNIKLVLNEEITKPNLYKTVADYINRTGTEYVVNSEDFIGAIGIFLNDAADSIVLSNVTEDNLHMVNISTLTPRTFNFAKAYTITEKTDLGETGEGTFTVNGFNANADKNIVEMAGFSGFDLQNKTTLNLNNFTMQNSTLALNSNNTDAEANINNVVLRENIKAITNDLGHVILEDVTIEGAVQNYLNSVHNLDRMTVSNSTISSELKNEGVLNLNDNSTLANLKNSGTANLNGNIVIDSLTNTNSVILSGTTNLTADIKGDGIISTANDAIKTDLTQTVITGGTFNMSKGILTFGTDTFKSVSEMNILSGIINLQDESTKNYSINKLTVNDTALFNLDVKIVSPKEVYADTFTVGSGSSGVLTLSEITGLERDSIAVSDRTEIKFINNAKDSNVTVKISEALRRSLEKEYTLHDYYNNDTGTYELTNNSFLGTTGIVLNEDATGVIVGYLTKLATLHETNISTLTPRQYSFADAGTVEEGLDLGDTGAGVFTVNGYSSIASESIIDLSEKYTGFNLINAINFTVNNVSIIDSTLALHLNNATANATLNNVIFSNNNIAIQNEKGTVTLVGVVVNKGTTAVQNSVENAGTMTIIDSSLLSVLTNTSRIETSGTNIFNEIINNSVLNLFADDSITKLTNNQSSTVNANNVTQVGELLNKGTANFDGKTNIATLKNEATVIVKGTSELTKVENKGTLNLNGEDVLGTVENYSTITSSNSTNYNNLTNYGEGKVTSTGETTYTTVYNLGTMNLNGNDVVAGPLTGEGVLNVQSVTTVVGSIAEEQNVNILKDSNLLITSGVMNINSNDTWIGSVLMTDAAGTLNYKGVKDGTTNANITANAGNLNVISSTLTIAAKSSISDAVLLNISEPAMLNITGGDVIYNLSDNWAGTVKLDNGNFTYKDSIINGTILANGGTLNVESGILNISDKSSIDVNSTLNITEGAVVSVNGGTVTINSPDKINGSIVGVNGNLNVVNRELTVPMLAIDAANKSRFNVNLDSTTVNTMDKDGAINDFVLGVLTVDKNSQFKIDVDLSTTKGAIDTITVGTGSVGTILITQLGNIDTPFYDVTRELKVLNRTDIADENGIYAINLELDSKLVANYHRDWTVETYINSNNTEYVIYDDTFIGETGVALNDKKDSVIFGATVVRDTLHEVNIYNDTRSKIRSYNFASARVVEENMDLGETGTGKFNVNGVSQNAADSTIDMSTKYSAFDLENNTTFTASNLTIRNSVFALKLNNADSSATLNNVVLSGNKTAIDNIAGYLSLNNVVVSEGNDNVENNIENKSDMDISNSTVLSNIANSGVITTSNTNEFAYISNINKLKLNGNDTVTTLINSDASAVISTEGTTTITTL